MFFSSSDEQFHLLCRLPHNAVPVTSIRQGKEPGRASGLDHDGLCRQVSAWGVVALIVQQGSASLSS